jgi:hypothetical protein
MPKNMKIIFEMPGTQIDAEYFSNGVLTELKKIVESDDYDENDIFDYIRNHRTGYGVSVSNGMFIHDEEMKCIIQDGDEQLDVTLMPFDESEEDLTYQELLEQYDLQDTGAVIAVNISSGISYLKKNDEPSGNQHIMLEVVDYSHGQLEGVFEVDENVTLKDLDMKDFVIETLDVDGEADVCKITYGEGLVGQMHEEEIRKLYYKGKDVELNLNYQGGSGYINIHIRDEDGDLIETPIDELTE